MNVTENVSGVNKNWLYRGITIVVVSTILSAFFGYFYEAIFYPDNTFDYYQGARTGASIGFVSSIIEVFYIRSVRRSWIKRVAFLPGLIVRILVLTLLVRICLVGNDILTDVLLQRELTVDSNIAEEVRDTLISMVLVVFFVTVSQLGSILGFRRFSNLVVGRYFRPVEEDRIFLFIDVVDSSRMAKRMGDVGFHNFLSDFFYHADAAIVRTGGEIVSYVGDAVIVTWPLRRKGRVINAPLKALKMLRQRMAAQETNFLRDHNAHPHFRAALHGGPVVVGECGDSRRQVTFLGDVVNMTARIEQACKELNQPYLASQNIVSEMVPPKGISFSSINEYELKGDSAKMHLYAINFEQA